MLRVFSISCLLVVLTTQSEIPKYLDGGIGYLARKLNKNIIAPTVTNSKSVNSEYINQKPNADLETLPVSQVENTSAPEITPYKSQESFIVLPSNTVETGTTPEPEIIQTSTTAEPITVSESIKLIPEEPAVVSIPPYFFDPFPISKELPVAVSRSRHRFPEIVYQVAVPVTGPVPVQETSSSTSTTELPTTQVSTTTEDPVTSTPLPSCVNGEIYPTDTGSCDQFLMCYNSVVVLLICPQGMGFNYQIRSCDWAEYVPACNTEGP